MWAIENQTPFGALGYFVRDKKGAEFWTVAIRARFHIPENGNAEIRDDQIAPQLAPVYALAPAQAGEVPRVDDARELLMETDFAPFRPHTDVFLTGVAQSDKVKPVLHQPFGFRLGDLQKQAQAHGARRIRKTAGGWRLIREDLLLPVPLSWTQSLGGVDPFDAKETNPDNPIGRGWSTHARQAPVGAEMELPAFQSVGKAYHPEDAPIGFGPIQPAWRPRLIHAGTYDEAWRKTQAPLPPLDFSEDFWQAAPQDQIYRGELFGREPVSIWGMREDGPYSFALPKANLRVNTKISNQWRQDRPRLIALSIDGTERTLDMVWNICVLCTGRDHEIDRSQVWIKRLESVRA